LCKIVGIINRPFPDFFVGVADRERKYGGVFCTGITFIVFILLAITPSLVMAMFTTWLYEKTLTSKE
jgi:hypothetical protein